MRGLRPLRRRLRALRAEGGYTLTELLTAMSILAVVLGSLTTVFVAATRAEVDVIERFAAQHELRTALDRIRREAHCATYVTGTPTPSEITLSLDAAVCPSGVSSVTWCTTASGTGFALYRVAPPTGTCTDGTKVADSLTSGAIFEYGAPSTASLARLKVDMTADTSPTTPGGAYRLCDEIALRNSGRSGSSTAPAPCPTV